MKGGQRAILILNLMNFAKFNEKLKNHLTSKKLPQRKSRGKFRRTRKRKATLGLPVYSTARDLREIEEAEEESSESERE